MKLINTKYFLFTLFLFLATIIVSAQTSDDIWHKTSELQKRTSKKIERKSLPTTFEVFELNLKTLKRKLNNTPKRKGKLKKSSTVVSFPNENGELEKYEVFETSILEESLQKKHPNIKSYIGKGVENPTSIVRFSETSLGLHAMIFKESGDAIYIDPYTSDKESCIVYTKKNLVNVSEFQCKVDEYNTITKLETSNVSAKAENADDGNLRTFRLAIATTGEYSQFHLNNQGISASETDAVKKDAVLSAIVATMVRVNGIFERDVALTMVLVANNTNIIFLDAETDGFTNDDGDVLIDESQTVIDGAIGSVNYDIGHTFSTGGGGLAELNSPCTNNKARGITGLNSPIGDPYAVDYVAHEIGHQFGATHTFNNSCNDNRSSGTAVEPGSGSTIMSYAGICAPNVQNAVDAYFHLVSIKQMWANITVGNSTCGVETSTNNNAPTLNILSNYTIPISTPFVLNTTASDIDGDALTYTWEQLDNEIIAHPLVSTATEGPAFRSVEPSSSSTRYFPSQATVIAGSLATTWEVLPSVSRTMRFGVNVRDNNLAGGQTASEETTITVDAESGPFEITSQQSSTTWDVGTAKTVTWNVSRTNISPVNCSFVNILFSSDGGLTYPTVLISNTPNDGSQEVVVPDISTSTGRIKVESVGNVFYAMNSSNITIQASEFVMNFDSYAKTACSSNNVAYNFTYNTFLGFNEVTTFKATGNPDGTTVTFSPASASSNNTPVVMTISETTNVNAGNLNILVTGTSETKIKTTAVSLAIFSSTINAPNLFSPDNNKALVLKPYTLKWFKDVNALSYDIQISTDNTFLSIIESATTTTNTFAPQLLQPNITYYWRVKAINDCGESAYSTVFNFKTANEICDSSNSLDTPLSIPDNNSIGISSIINYTSNKIITNISVTVNITHTWDGDLTMYLTSPKGTTVLLSAENGGEGKNYINTVFNNNAASLITTGTAPFTGVFQPQGDLSLFNNEEAIGDWTLKVIDSGPADIGSIDNWSVEICGVPMVLNDSDIDGVLDVDDQCANTPLGSNVDTNGCVIFTLPPNNFSFNVIGETCPNTNNGQLIIEAQSNQNYEISITGATNDNISYNYSDSFNTMLLVSNLPPGLYDFCITIGTKFNQCYSFEVADGEQVVAESKINSNKASIEMKAGTAPFVIYVNGKEVFTTSATEFSVAVKHGDIVDVKTAVACEGVYSKTIELLEDIVAYPNPTTGAFEISLPDSTNEVVIELYSIHSQLISVKTYPILYGKVQLNIENQTAGLYIAKVYLENPKILKIIKY
tara:strand:- start:30695 stop:34528 length:3834 start_codon:yes stop_codon:yes gene_type:complete